jgi:hypothetical protein
MCCKKYELTICPKNCNDLDRSIVFVPSDEDVIYPNEKIKYGSGWCNVIGQWVTILKPKIIDDGWN